MWHDIELYLRQPTYGGGYLIGSVQLQDLIADESRRLGDAFKLRDCMDTFCAAGMIPTALIRWEMTGLDDQVRRLWPEGFASKEDGMVTVTPYERAGKGQRCPNPGCDLL
jgi:hypothetical protein